MWTSRYRCAAAPRQNPRPSAGVSNGVPLPRTPAASSATRACVAALLVSCAPHSAELLLTLQGCQVAFDSIARRDFLLCDYNRDGDSYRCVCAPVKCHAPAGW